MNPTSRQLSAHRDQDRFRSQHPWAFTLVELLAVVAIMGLMLALAGSGASSLMTTLRMKEAIQTVGNSMEHARQLAMTSNHEVVFRIYKVQNDRGEDAWRSMEFGTVNIVTNPDIAGYKDPTAANYEPPFTPAGAPEKLPEGVVFHPGATYSTLLAENQTDLVRGAETAPNGQTRSYVSFRYLPDGRCSLSTAQKWTLTLVKQEEAASGGLPANFATMQLEPATARVRFYRP